ncbi:P-loop containing nucleoside triphosphate hydrolase protein [Mycena floridula]|nr:P-loop containing nucleoside triphosphate hydrolase protein [Mycena floridula]
MASENTEDRPRFLSAAGSALCHRILLPLLPFTPHDDQIEGICAALDGIDTFAILPTSAGKTGLFFMYILVARAISRDLLLCSWKAFPRNPVLIAVCPTNYIENQLESTLLKYDLVGLVINAETYQAALLDPNNRVDLWEKARNDEKISMLIISPEQLVSDHFRKMLNDESYWTRVCALGVDEVHLVVPWGAQFRQPFRQIALARSRLPDTAVLIVLTATMRTGLPFQSVCKFLSLGQYHLIRRSNLRPDIQIIYREIKSSIGGRRFPELDWVLTSGRTVILFCRTINLGTRVQGYLLHADQGDPETATKRIRTYNALNWPTFNEETRILVEKYECMVVIGTTTIAVGVDIANVQDVMIFGDPSDADEMFQMLRRIRVKYSDIPSDARGIVYFLSKSHERAEEAILKAKAKASGAKSLEKDAPNAMDLSLALFVLALCKVDEQDRQYDNPSDTVPCSCPTCQKFPRLRRRVPCDCSGCMPDFEPPMPERDQQPEDDSLPPKKDRLTVIIKEYGFAQFVQLRMKLYRSAILDHFSLISSIEDLTKYINMENRHVAAQIRDIYEFVELLRPKFVEMRAQRKAELKEAREAAAKLLKEPRNDAMDDEGTIEVDE